MTISYYYYYYIIFIIIIATIIITWSSQQSTCHVGNHVEVEIYRVQYRWRKREEDEKSMIQDEAWDRDSKITGLLQHMATGRAGSRRCARWLRLVRDALLLHSRSTSNSLRHLPVIISAVLRRPRTMTRSFFDVTSKNAILWNKPSYFTTTVSQTGDPDMGTGRTDHGQEAVLLGMTPFTGQPCNSATSGNPTHCVLAGTQWSYGTSKTGYIFRYMVLWLVGNDWTVVGWVLRYLMTLSQI